MCVLVSVVSGKRSGRERTFDSGRATPRGGRDSRDTGASAILRKDLACKGRAHKRDATD